MKYLYVLIICLFCFNIGYSKENPELIFRPQTAEEAFEYVDSLSSKLPWFLENGYKVSLPEHPAFDAFYHNYAAYTDQDKVELKEIFSNEIYDVSSFDVSLIPLRASENTIRKGIKKLSHLQKNWGFKLLDKYEGILTLYGTGGDYTMNGKVRLFTTLMGKEGRTPFYEVLLHEMVHIGIHDKLVKKYKLRHWEKERLVDLICYHCLSDVLPGYRMQSKGDRSIDAFIDEDAILYDLPSAIALFTRHFPR